MNDSPRLWDLIDQASLLDDALTLHLAVGRPPMVRIADAGLRPLDENLPVMTWRTINLMLSTVVEPERWEEIERVGEGEIALIPGGNGAPVTLSMFRNSTAWSVVVRF
ncbi:MAG: hypothetical protein JJU11_00135 [Candidatus Sumerlaeia bacterium]|nr:hypothetical protein [Candidatus Sumerlaeia bacterium]